jgi:hypothetical protein
MAEVLDLPAELYQISALHGLGHRHHQRVEQIIDDFLAAKRAAFTPRVLEYASQTRLGLCPIKRLRQVG